MENILKIYTDGGARGNPGPAASAFVVIADGAVIYKGAKFLGIKTNNEAEYQSVILALNWLFKNKESLDERDILFCLDSELVVRQLTGVYKIKSEKLKTLAQEVHRFARRLGKSIFYKEVRREKNKLADKLVNNEIDENT